MTEKKHQQHLNYKGILITRITSLVSLFCKIANGGEVKQLLIKYPGFLGVIADQRALEIIVSYPNRIVQVLEQQHHAHDACFWRQPSYQFKEFHIEMAKKLEEMHQIQPFHLPVPAKHIVNYVTDFMYLLFDENMNIRFQ